MVEVWIWIRAKRFGIVLPNNLESLISYTLRDHTHTKLTTTNGEGFLHHALIASC